MARHRRRFPPRCRRCKLERLPEETWLGGFCPACKTFLAAKRRKATGSRVLARAKPQGTEERDGQMFQVVQLPPKRSGRRRR
jgi:hypothetical protein